MKRILRVVTVEMLVGTTMRADARNADLFATGACGLSWGADYTELTSRYRFGSYDHSVRLSAALEGDFICAGQKVQRVATSFDRLQHGLVRVSFRIDKAAQAEFLRELIEVLGQPRSVTFKEGRANTHVLEWRRPDFNLTTRLSTAGSAMTDEPLRDSMFFVRRGPILDSQIDRWNNYQKDRAKTRIEARP